MQDSERFIITTRGYSHVQNEEIFQRICDFIDGGNCITPHDSTHFPAYHP